MTSLTMELQVLTVGTGIEGLDSEFGVQLCDHEAEYLLPLPCTKEEAQAFGGILGKKVRLTVTEVQE